ncbi:MAG: hypothetical protein M3Z41_07380 [Candidatus Eremiobacteraeota bacterium]|nr:hypothetical protein [Candidatus Eremiobacteraeota bacterium]
MATPISIAHVARVAVSVVATIWAVLGLGDALAAATAHGIDAFVATAIAVNAALLCGAVMAFANAGSWRAVVIVAMTAVTADRILSVLGTGDYLLALSSVVMLVAVIAIAAVARAR